VTPHTGGVGGSDRILVINAGQHETVGCPGRASHAPGSSLLAGVRERVLHGRMI
jgi:hypothetical protein